MLVAYSDPFSSTVPLQHILVIATKHTSVNACYIDNAIILTMYQHSDLVWAVYDQSVEVLSFVQDVFVGKVTLQWL